jgi:hypothetical protein
MFVSAHFSVTRSGFARRAKNSPLDELNLTERELYVKKKKRYGRSLKPSGGELGKKLL